MQRHLIEGHWGLAIATLFIGIATAAQAQMRLTTASRVQANGIGPVRIGMTVPEAEQATGMRLVGIGHSSEDGSCFYVGPEDDALDIGFMVMNGEIARVDVGRNSPILTLSGAGVGDSEARIFALYPGQIEVRGHPYVVGHYLTFVPRDEVDKQYRVIFETQDDRVTAYRAGRLPEVLLIEGCS